MTKIIQRDCLDLFKEDMKRYSIYILRSRVVPNAKDGLKMIHRRIVYGTYEYEKAIDKKVKSTAIMGSVMKKLHPHGDTSVYDAMWKMINWFSINLPLLAKQGNWGNIQGGSPSAARYTEAGLSKFCIDWILSELRQTKAVVDWIPNYTETDKEPEYLPVMVPLLLLNGVFGIAVGMRCYVPKHAVNDVIDATINLIYHPEDPVILIPDQCQPCEIVKTNFKLISNTGHGSFVARGIIEIGNAEGIDKYNASYPALFIKSTPDMVSMLKVEESISDLIEKDKLLPQIINMFDNSDPDQIDFVIVLKKGSDPKYVRDLLYKKTELQKTFTVNCEVLDGIQPLRMSYKSYLQYYLELRKDTKFRLYSNKYQEVKTRLNQIEAYIKVLQSGEVDNVIDLIKRQATVDDNYVIEYLVEKLGINTLQARFIINANLKHLSIGYLNKYVEEYNKLTQLLDEYLNKIANENLILDEIVNELKQFKKEYGQKRLSKIISESELSNIPEGEFKIVITQNNFIKKIGISESIGYLRDDSPKFVLKVENTEDIIIFDEKGKVFRLPVHKIPLSEKGTNGTDIRKLSKNLTSNINTILYKPRLEYLANKTTKYFVTVLTQNGLIKRMDLEDFLGVTLSGMTYIKLDPDDVVKSVNIVANGLDIIVYSKNKALRMNLEEVPYLKRNTKGNKSIADDTLLDGLAIVKPDTTDVIVITEKGHINRFSIAGMPNIGRNKNAISVIKLSRGDSIKEILTVNEHNMIRIITKNNKLELPVSELISGSSISSGDKIINTKADVILRCDIIKNKNV